MRYATHTALAVALLICVFIGLARAQTTSQTSATKHGPRYGSNPAVGKTITYDGVELYYEIYGSSEPLLLIHGNGESIASFSDQSIIFGGDTASLRWIAAINVNCPIARAPYSLSRSNIGQMC